VCLEPSIIPPYFVDILVLKEEPVPSISLGINPQTRYALLLKRPIDTFPYCSSVPLFDLRDIDPAQVNSNPWDPTRGPVAETAEATQECLVEGVNRSVGIDHFG